MDGTCATWVFLTLPSPLAPCPQVWDLRKDDEPAMVLKGHADTLTGMRVSPDGSHLLTNAMDGTLRVWDMRPYAPQNRCVKVFNGEALSLIGTQRKKGHFHGQLGHSLSFRPV